MLINSTTYSPEHSNANLTNSFQSSPPPPNGGGNTNGLRYPEDFIDQGIVTETINRGWKIAAQTDVAIFLLNQQILYAQNLVGNGNIVNAPAVLGMLPFTQGDVHTALDLEPGLNSIATSLYGKKLTQYDSSQATYDVDLGDGNTTQTLQNVRITVPLSTPADLALSYLKGQINNGIQYIESKIGIEPADAIKQLFDSSPSKTFSLGIKGAINHFAQVDDDTKNNRSTPYVKGTINTHDDVQLIKSQQVFPFFLTSLNYPNASSKKHITFQSIINGLTESYAPVWSSDELFGRVHPIWVYSNVNRSINIEFVMVALKRDVIKDGISPVVPLPGQQDGLTLLQKRADWLAKHTYPTFSDNGTDSVGNVHFTNFKSGPFVSLTIGNLYQSVNGFISSLDFDWNYTHRWDTQDYFPQGVKVNMKFNILEDQFISNNDSDNDIYKIYNVFNNNLGNSIPISYGGAQQFSQNQAYTA